MSDADYKHKYFDLRAKFLKATDTAWRLGYENGLKDAQVQQMQQQQQEAQMAAQQAAQMGQDPNAQPDQGQDQDQSQIGKPQDDSQEQQQAQPQEGQDHLGQSIDELGSAVQKSELVSRSRLADYNLDANAKRANNMQKKIVEDILKKWEEETPKTIDDILKVVSTHK